METINFNSGFYVRNFGKFKKDCAHTKQGNDHEKSLDHYCCRKIVKRSSIFYYDSNRFTKGKKDSIACVSVYFSKSVSNPQLVRGQFKQI